MPKSRDKKTRHWTSNDVITFHLPEPIKPPTLREESARVVDVFIGTLDIESDARTFALEVSAERIRIHRRRGRNPAPGAIMVPLDSLLSICKERYLATAMRANSTRNDLWMIVDAAAGNMEISAGDLNLAKGQIGVAAGNIAFKLTG